MTRYAYILLAALFSLGVSANGSPGVEKRAFAGSATWSEQGLGACGITTTDSQLVTGVQAQYFDTFPGYDGSNPNDNPICGRKLTATYKGKSVTATITDRDIGGGKYDLNFSPTAFEKLAPTSKGRISGVSWALVAA